jgi:hypothetical protein
MRRAVPRSFATVIVALLSLAGCSEPGTDPYYGKGRINVARALGLTP